MRELVRLRQRLSRDGKRFSYMLDFVDQDGKRRQLSLGHSDKRKAERQCADKERELRMDVLAPPPMKLSTFLEDSLARTGSQIRESTNVERRAATMDFISLVGDINYQAVTLRHAELFRQTCLDRGNRGATVSKKLRQLKRLFQLAVNRKQLDENPIKLVELPKSPKRKIRVFAAEECDRILKAAQVCQQADGVRWDLLIAVALTTGARRGEFLNSVWADIDFQKLTFDVSPKDSTAETWQWLIKDTERRTLPLTEQVVTILAEHQSRQPEGYPYVFVPPHRYDRIQQLRKQAKWTFIDARLNVLNNFGLRFKKILKRASVKTGCFHDFRSTALTNWLAAGMSELDVMRLAGHSSFTTTHTFYLSVADDLVDRARAASAKSIGQNLLRACCAPHFSAIDV